jgi:hypothetical protein
MTVRIFSIATPVVSGLWWLLASGEASMLPAVTIAVVAFLCWRLWLGGKLAWAFLLLSCLGGIVLTFSDQQGGAALMVADLTLTVGQLALLLAPDTMRWVGVRL